MTGKPLNRHCSLRVLPDLAGGELSQVAETRHRLSWKQAIEGLLDPDQFPQQSEGYRPLTNYSTVDKELP
jgi:hypothetical protein